MGVATSVASPLGELSAKLTEGADRKGGRCRRSVNTATIRSVPSARRHPALCATFPSGEGIWAEAV